MNLSAATPTFQTGDPLYLSSGYNEMVDPQLAGNPYTAGIRPGVMYLSVLTGYRPARNQYLGNPMAVRIYASDDGGFTWSTGQDVHSTTSSSGYSLDKPALAVSYYSGTLGYIYVAWVDIFSNGAMCRTLHRMGGIESTARVVSPKPWDPSETVYTGAANERPYTPQVIVNPTNGNVYVFWLTAPDNFLGTLYMRRWVNATGAWSDPIALVPGVRITANGGYLTNNLRAVVAPTVRFNAGTGRVMAVWHASTVAGATDETALYYVSIDADVVSGSARRVPRQFLFHVFERLALERHMVEHREQFRRLRFRSPMMRILLVTLAAAFTMHVHARDVWVVNGRSATLVRDCAVIAWDADAVFHNRGAATADVVLVGASDGAFEQSVVMHVPALTSVWGRASGLAGSPATPLWVTHLDVPEGVAVEGRLEYRPDLTCPGPPAPSQPAGKIAMPVFERLAAAGEVQVHEGTDLGGQSVRINVGVYNAGEVAAVAHVRVDAPFCEAGTLLAETTATVAANSVTQIRLDPPPCSIYNARGEWVKRTTITVDQPSLTFVSVLSNEAPPGVTATVASP